MTASLITARDKFVRLLQIHAPQIHGANHYQAALDAMTDGLKEFEAAVREDERDIITAIYDEGQADREVAIRADERAIVTAALTALTDAAARATAGGQLAEGGTSTVLNGILEDAKHEHVSATPSFPGQLPLSDEHGRLDLPRPVLPGTENNPDGGSIPLSAPDATLAVQDSVTGDFTNVPPVADLTAPPLTSPSGKTVTEGKKGRNK